MEILFALKARCGWREGEMPPGQVIHANQVMINMPGQLSAEAFRELTGGGGNEDDQQG